MRRLLAFLGCAAVFSWNLWNVNLASGYIDPLLHTGSQDEATYTREAILMALNGAWMTPVFLGRLVFEKPPLLIWLSGLSMKAFGVGRFAARLPSIIAGALLCTALFIYIERTRTGTAAVAAAALTLSSALLATMARRNMTDILLAAFLAVALTLFCADTLLTKWRTRVGIALCVAGAILTKSAAGLLIPAIIAASALVLCRDARPRIGRLAGVCGAGLFLAAPWFIFSLQTHREWFLADTRFQLLTVGSGAHQTASSGVIPFYLERLLCSDPVSLLLAGSATAAFIHAVRSRSPEAVVLAVWLGVSGAALLLFRFRSEQYLCIVIPAIVLVAARYSPFLSGRNGRRTEWVVATIVISLIAKAMSPSQPWGIDFRSGSTVPATQALTTYCQQRRDASLYILDVDDEFFSAVLPLPAVHYGWLDQAGTAAADHPYLRYLGVLMPADEIATLPARRALYLQRLRARGLNDATALATGIYARDRAQLSALIGQHPESDFLVSRAVLPDPGAQHTHVAVQQEPAFTLLEARHGGQRGPDAWACSI